MSQQNPPDGFKGQGGRRKGFVARNEIEDMRLFDGDPGKPPADQDTEAALEEDSDMEAESVPIEGSDRLPGGDDDRGEGSQSPWAATQWRGSGSAAMDSSYLEILFRELSFPATREEIVLALEHHPDAAHEHGMDIPALLKRMHRERFGSRSELIEALENQLSHSGS